MSGLPKLPGFSFNDLTITKYHVPHSFHFINGYRIPLPCEFGLGGRELDASSVQYLKKEDPVKFDPSLTYGRVRGVTLPQYTPHFAHYDKKCLNFKAFFKQTVVESPDEHYRIRHVNIIYFLEDDSITVMEPKVRNCGFNQGRLVRRAKIPKKAGINWHWKDLNIGIDMCLYGIVYHTVDCDGFTREYMASQGIDINPSEDLPPDPYIQARELTQMPTTRITPPLDDKMRRFLEYDGKILKFSAVWDNRDAEYGELKEYVVLYFLADDTVSVKEIHTPNDGCDPTPLLLKKTKLPKNWKDRPTTYPSIYMELSDSEVTEFYQPKDFKIGETIFILGRRFLLFDCDEFTRKYYERVLNIKQGPKIEVFEKKEKVFKKCMPPHGELGLGTLEDSLQNCFQTIPTRPRRDEVRMMLNATKTLRYTMEMDWVHPEDSIRKFIMTYFLADGTIKIQEPPLRNSGIVGGKFLRRSLIEKPATNPLNPEYYTPADFYIGAIIQVHGHRFIITGADLYVYRYIQDNLNKFSNDVVDNVRNYMFNQGYLKDDIKGLMEENREAERKEEIDSIGRELEIIKTERQKCLEMYEQQKEDAAKQFAHSESAAREKQAIEKKEGKVEGPHYGLKPLEKECPYSVDMGTLPTFVCEDKNETYSYPKTKEEKLKEYYDDVLKRHEEACLKAAQYKKTHECLPGTILKPPNVTLTDKMQVSKQERPSPTKDSPCVKKSVRFVEPLDKCAQEIDDICNLKPPVEHYNCTEYDKKRY